MSDDDADDGIVAEVEALDRAAGEPVLYGRRLRRMTAGELGLTSRWEQH